MSTLVEKLPDEPVAIVTHHPPYDPEYAIQYAEEELERFLGNSEAPLYVITDYNAIDISFMDLMFSLRVTASMKGDASIQSKKTRHILVGENELIQLGADALAQEQYGGVEVPCFASVDEALAYCRTNA